ncbi:hypothetical protein IPG41_03280 [Candidatus Peregrinibacteria bacterium]|nr:MAG: hypothetical protein IPG41_03280 [Candidatus Peregrinibacteria bacterium]
MPVEKGKDSKDYSVYIERRLLAYEALLAEIDQAGLTLPTDINEQYERGLELQKDLNEMKEEANPLNAFVALNEIYKNLTSASVLQNEEVYKAGILIAQALVDFYRGDEANQQLAQKWEQEVKAREQLKGLSASYAWLFMKLSLVCSLIMLMYALN